MEHSLVFGKLGKHGKQVGQWNWGIYKEHSWSVWPLENSLSIWETILFLSLVFNLVLYFNFLFLYPNFTLYFYFLFLFSTLISYSLFLFLLPRTFTLHEKTKLLATFLLTIHSSFSKKYFLKLTHSHWVPKSTKASTHKNT